MATLYPGVYVKESSTGVRTITGVPTSITAFIGGAVAGPVNAPTMCNNLAEFERIFGGLAADQPLAYAVRDFFANGGAHALIVRVAASDAAAATITLPAADRAGQWVLQTTSVGLWGNRLNAAVVHAPGEANSGRFDLLVRYQPHADRGDVLVEHFVGLSVQESDPRFITQVLESESAYVSVSAASSARPAATLGALSNDLAWVQAVGGLDGPPLSDADVIGSRDLKTGVHALLQADLFNLLCIPPKRRGERTSPEVYQVALALCVERRAMLIVDPDPTWGSDRARAVESAIAGRNELGLTGEEARNAALYFPSITQADPLQAGQVGTFAPCGAIAGIIARSDAQRGVWKAPAGTEATLNGAYALQVDLSDAENGRLNQLGINCLRSFPARAPVVWGARTLRGADMLADEYKYIPVRRLALYIEESLYRGTQWAAFEPNDEPLWAQLRSNIGAFMHQLFRDGAFQGQTDREAYFVKCDQQTTTQSDIDQGVVNIVIGFAPLKPAEFVVITIRQLAGQRQE